MDVFGVRPCRPLDGNEVEDVNGSRVGKGDGVDLGREEGDMAIAGLRFPSPGGFTGKPASCLLFPVLKPIESFFSYETSTPPAPVLTFC